MAKSHNAQAAQAWTLRAQSLNEDTAQRQTLCSYVVQLLDVQWRLLRARVLLLVLAQLGHHAGWGERDVDEENNFDGRTTRAPYAVAQQHPSKRRMNDLRRIHAIDETRAQRS